MDFQKGRSKEVGLALRGRRIRQRLTRLTRPRVDVHIGGLLSLREIRHKKGKPAERWDYERGPCDTDDVTQGDPGGSAAQAVTGGGQRAVTN